MTVSMIGSNQLMFIFVLFDKILMIGDAMVSDSICCGLELRVRKEAVTSVAVISL